MCNVHAVPHVRFHTVLHIEAAHIRTTPHHNATELMRSMLACAHDSIDWCHQCQCAFCEPL